MVEDRCPICLKVPAEELRPFCSVICLKADPKNAKDLQHRRRYEQFLDRIAGAGGSGGMVSVDVDYRLCWYLAGAQDEAAVGGSRVKISWTAEKISELRRLVKEGLTDRQIGLLFNCGHKAICANRNRFGIHGIHRGPPRPRSTLQDPYCTQCRVKMRVRPGEYCRLCLNERGELFVEAPRG